ncbi:MAG: ComEA family DNA-binding protein [Chloroflexi bacterium]|nr:ComEA family DNA-binding protein [Chloroflexota bacterium]
MAGQPGPVGGPTWPRSVVVSGALAAVLAAGAFVLAFGGGPAGTVEVEGGAPFEGSGAAGASGALPAVGTTGGSLVVVEIVGAISRPGVFRLPPDARIGDLVTAAGGYGPRVDVARAGRELNLAAQLHDGEQVRVPSRDDPPAPTPGPATNGGTGSGGTTNGSGATGLIDLNHASATELESLYGIGPVTSGKIIASREEQPFVTVDDLRTRKLVGENTFEKLRDLVTVS